LIFDREEVRRLRQEGLSIEKIARHTGLSVGTVVRVLQAQENGSGTFQNPPTALRQQGSKRKNL
jgi:uncharacterized protein YerC